MAESSTLQKWFSSSFNSMGFFLKYISEKAELHWALDEYLDFFFFKAFPMKIFSTHNLLKPLGWGAFCKATLAATSEGALPAANDKHSTNIPVQLLRTILHQQQFAPIPFKTPSAEDQFVIYRCSC